MENDYISREAVIKDLLSDTVIADDLFGMGALHERDRVIAKINDFPAADVRPVVHGEWVPAASYNDGVINTAYCSACHDYLPPGEADNWPFCPNCGADMSQKGGSNE